MRIEVQLATAAGVVSLAAALFHAWVFALHRPARDHGWVALTALGASGISFGTALLYAGTTVADALRAHRISIGGAALVMGALHFSASRLRVHLPRLLASARLLSAVSIALVLVAPQWL